MKTHLIPAAITACACFVFALPATGGFAPERINGIHVKFTGERATFPDDLRTIELILNQDALTRGAFRYYSQSKPDIGVLRFTRWNEGSGTYSGTFTMKFSSAKRGTFYKAYTGTYKGFISGPFEIIGMDVAKLPLAKAKTVSVKKNRSLKFRLAGQGFDIPKKNLKYRILRKPKSGKLITDKLPSVTYQPKRGFTGTVKFQYTVKEGGSVSKPATVTLKVK